jgi:hypothetical protein
MICTVAVTTGNSRRTSGWPREIRVAGIAHNRQAGPAAIDATSALSTTERLPGLVCAPIADELQLVQRHTFRMSLSLSTSPSRRPVNFLSTTTWAPLLGLGKGHSKPCTSARPPSPPPPAPLPSNFALPAHRPPSRLARQCVCVSLWACVGVALRCITCCTRCMFERTCVWRRQEAAVSASLAPAGALAAVANNSALCDPSALDPQRQSFRPVVHQFTPRLISSDRQQDSALSHTADPGQSPGIGVTSVAVLHQYTKPCECTVRFPRSLPIGSILIRCHPHVAGFLWSARPLVYEHTHGQREGVSLPRCQQRPL